MQNFTWIYFYILLGLNIFITYTYNIRKLFSSWMSYHICCFVLKQKIETMRQVSNAKYGFHVQSLENVWHTSARAWQFTNIDEEYSSVVSRSILTVVWYSSCCSLSYKRSLKVCHFTFLILETEIFYSFIVSNIRMHKRATKDFYVIVHKSCNDFWIIL